jgi:hypothetical protein
MALRLIKPAANRHRVESDFYRLAQRWDDEVCPHTCEEAKPTDWMIVTNQRVIKVVNARYRWSTQTDTFLLASIKVSRLNQLKEPRVKVYCRWFGHTLAKGGPITLRLAEGQFEIIENYSGSIVTDLSADLSVDKV